MVKYTHDGNPTEMVRPSQEPSAYRTDEAARRIGCSKSTLLRWFREGKVRDVARDRRGWRIFKTEDIRRIRRWAHAESEGAGR